MIIKQHKIIISFKYSVAELVEGALCQIGSLYGNPGSNPGTVTFSFFFFFFGEKKKGVFV